LDEVAARDRGQGHSGPGGDLVERDLHMRQSTFGWCVHRCTVIVLRITLRFVEICLHRTGPPRRMRGTEHPRQVTDDQLLTELLRGGHMSTVSLNGLSHVYENTTSESVHPFNLFVDTGEFLVLYGPSGSGKSTILRMLHGLETPKTGTILIDGVDITHAAVNDRDVTLALESDALPPRREARGAARDRIWQDRDGRGPRLGARRPHPAAAADRGAGQSRRAQTEGADHGRARGQPRARTAVRDPVADQGSAAGVRADH